MGILSFLQKKERTPETVGAAIVVAAGSASRMGGTDKLLLELNGIPVLAYSLLAFEVCESIRDVVVVTRSEKIVLVGEIVSEFELTKVRHIVKGGDTRTRSVAAGLGELREDVNFVAVHDGARPLVTPAMIDGTMEKAVEYGAAAPGTMPKDTVKHLKDGFIGGTIPRERVVCIQTPQCFDIALLRGAVTKAENDGITYTDDCAAVEALGMGVYVTKGDYRNIKITTPEDVSLAEALLRQEVEV